MNDSSSPASDAGMLPGDVIVGVGDVVNPTQEQLRDLITTSARQDPGQPLVITVERDGQEVQLEMVPELDTVDGVELGRVGIVLGTERIGVVPSLVAGVKEVGFAIQESVSQVGRVFGPEGIGRVFTSLHERRTARPRRRHERRGHQPAGRRDLVLRRLGDDPLLLRVHHGVHRADQPGAAAAVRRWASRGARVSRRSRRHTVDMRKLIPVSAAVIAFFVDLRGRDHVPGLREADPDPVATFPQVTGTVATISQHRLRLRRHLRGLRFGL